jgi:hypothetical protein
LHLHFKIYDFCVKLGKEKDDILLPPCHAIGNQQLLLAVQHWQQQVPVFDFLLIFLFLFLFFFFVPPGHIIQYFPVQALYPEPCTRPYGIRIYLHSSALRALTAGRFRPTRPATVVGKACFITF